MFPIVPYSKARAVCGNAEHRGLDENGEQIWSLGHGWPSQVDRMFGRVLLLGTSEQTIGTWRIKQ